MSSQVFLHWRQVTTSLSPTTGLESLRPESVQEFVSVISQARKHVTVPQQVGNIVIKTKSAYVVFR